MSKSKVRVLHEDCDPTSVDDKSLPCTAFFVTYMKGGRKCHDLVIAGKQVDIFDHYWDCLLYTSPSPRDATLSRMPSSA